MVPLAMASTTRLALPTPWPLSALNQVEILYPGWTWVLQVFTFAVFVAVVLYVMMGSGQYCRSNELMSHPLNGQDVQIIITGMQQDAILQLQNQQKDSGARTQSDNLASLSDAPVSHRARAGLSQVNLDLMDPGDYKNLDLMDPGD